MLSKVNYLLQKRIQNPSFKSSKQIHNTQQTLHFSSVKKKKMKIKGLIGQENATILKTTGMGLNKEEYFQCRGGKELHERSSLTSLTF